MSQITNPAYKVIVVLVKLSLDNLTVSASGDSFVELLFVCLFLNSVHLSRDNWLVETTKGLEDGGYQTKGN